MVITVNSDIPVTSTLAFSAIFVSFVIASIWDHISNVIAHSLEARYQQLLNLCSRIVVHNARIFGHLASGTSEVSMTASPAPFEKMRTGCDKATSERLHLTSSHMNMDRKADRKADRSPIRRRSPSHSRSRSPYSRRRDYSSSAKRRDSRSRSPRFRSQSRSPRRGRSRSRSPIRDRRSRRSLSRSQSRSRSPVRRRDGGEPGHGRGFGGHRGHDDRGGYSGQNRGGRGRGRGGGPRHESSFKSGGGPAGPGKPDIWGAEIAAAEEAERKKKPVIAEEDKEKPNFGLSGSLAAETNTTVNGTLLKYNEPPEARKPSQKWRLYVFKGDKEIDLLHIHRQSAFLFGRDRNVVDIPIDHPSCSKQHAVLQFRQIVETDALGQAKRTTKPFVIDLESANGTFVNGTQIPPTRYYELKLSDVLKFGASTREFVLLHESANA